MVVKIGLWACHGYHKYSNLSTIWNITSRKLRFMQIGLHKYTNISVKRRDIGRPCTNILFDEYLLQATRCVLASLKMIKEHDMTTNLKWQIQ